MGEAESRRAECLRSSRIAVRSSPVRIGGPGSHTRGPPLHSVSCPTRARYFDWQTRVREVRT